MSGVEGYGEYGDGGVAIIGLLIQILTFVVLFGSVFITIPILIGLSPFIALGGALYMLPIEDALNLDMLSAYGPSIHNFNIALFLILPLLLPILPFTGISDICRLIFSCDIRRAFGDIFATFITLVISIPLIVFCSKQIFDFDLAYELNTVYITHMAYITHESYHEYFEHIKFILVLCWILSFVGVINIWQSVVSYDIRRKIGEISTSFLVSSLLSFVHVILWSLLCSYYDKSPANEHTTANSVRLNLYVIITPIIIQKMLSFNNKDSVDIIEEPTVSEQNPIET
jgi:hypothetical protein